MPRIDRTRVRRSFDGHAGEYDTATIVQKRVVEHCLQRLEREALAPSQVLDVGSGTGRLLASLRGIYPAATLVGVDLAFSMCRTARANTGDFGTFVTGDCEHLPFGDGVFDLVVSTSTLQWMETLEPAFREVRRVLGNGGHFLFALFGERTLHELRSAYRDACACEGLDGGAVTHSFASSRNVADALLRAGFVDARIETGLEVEMHRDVQALLRSLKRAGAGNATVDRPRGLARRAVISRMIDTYCREHGGGGGVPATYEVIYGLARKPLS